MESIKLASSDKTDKSNFSQAFVNLLNFSIFILI